MSLPDKSLYDSQQQRHLVLYTQYSDRELFDNPNLRQSVPQQSGDS